jgi:hypothetical protein
MITGTADQLEVRRPGQAPPAVSTCEHTARDGMEAGDRARGSGGSRGGAGLGDDAGAPDLRIAAAMSCTEGVSAAAETGAHVGVPGPGPGGASGMETKATTKLDTAILRTQARAALTGLGWKPVIAHAAVEAAPQRRARR